MLYTGFNATAGTASYGNFVDGNLSNNWQVRKSYGDPNAPAGDFNGGTENPAYVEFHSDGIIIPKGYVLTYDNSVNENWKPTSWAFKAKFSENDNWTTIHSSNSSLGNGSRFEIACTNDGNNQYQYFLFEIYDVGSTYVSVLNELQIYGKFTYTPVSARAATCTEYGLTNDGYLRNDGKYFSDENGTEELTAGDGLIDKIAHNGVHHEASDSNIEYWQCSMCHKYFTDAACTQEVTADEVFKGIFGTLTTGTNGESGYYTLESKTYTLTEDVNTAGYIYVPEGVTATIDLNGHTIDRGLTSAVKNGMVIRVAGSLTATDSGTGGTIKGGMDNSLDHVSCVWVYSNNGGAAFTLQGGTLIGNTSTEYNKAVMGGSNTNITISGGKITGDATGIYSFGNITVSGGEISGNITGINTVNGSVSVSGNPVITGNTNRNVALTAWGTTINITGALTEGANIGITATEPTDNAPVTVTSGYGTYNSKPVSTYFSLDNNGQIQTGSTEYMKVVMGWNEDRTEIAVGTAMRTVNFDLQGHGSAIEAVSLLSGYKLIKPTEPTAEGWNFGGWYTNEDCTDGNAWDFASGVTSDMTLYALWSQGELYKFTLPDKMVIVSATNEPFGGRYPAGTVIRFKTAPDYVLDGDVKNGNETLTADGEGIYTITVGNADITITATVKKAVEPNKTLSGSENYTANNGDVLTGSTSGTVTIASGASITLSDVTITGGIVCEGSITIILVGTNSVTGATNKAGIEVGVENTTLTIKGNGSLTATGGNQSAGIGLSCAWDPANNVIGGDIVIESGTITANGGSQWGAGIGTGVIYGNGNAKTARIGKITIKGGTVKATGGSEADGIGTGYTYSPCTNAIGTITIYDGIDKVDASSIKDFANVVYMHGENNVTENKTEYFVIANGGNKIISKTKLSENIAIADIRDYVYTGSAIEPEPAVKSGSLTFAKGTDYEYSYSNNTNPGTATVTVTFKGDYSSLGSANKEFNIINVVPMLTASTENLTAKKGDTITAITITATQGNNITWNTSGELPDGLTGKNSGNEFKISGTISHNVKLKIFNYVIRAENELGTAEKQIVITVTGGGTVTPTPTPNPVDDNTDSGSGGYETQTDLETETPDTKNEQAEELVNNMNETVADSEAGQAIAEALQSSSPEIQSAAIEVVKTLNNYLKPEEIAQLKPAEIQAAVNNKAEEVKDAEKESRSGIVEDTTKPAGTDILARSTIAGEALKTVNENLSVKPKIITPEAASDPEAAEIAGNLSNLDENQIDDKDVDFDTVKNASENMKSVDDIDIDEADGDLDAQAEKIEMIFREIGENLAKAENSGGGQGVVIASVLPNMRPKASGFFLLKVNLRNITPGRKLKFEPSVEAFNTRVAGTRTVDIFGN